MATDLRERSCSVLRFDGPMITPLFESSEQRLMAHLSHLKRASPFFQAVFKKEWKEGQEALVTLPDDDMDIVNTYLHFIYTGKIACRSPESDIACPADDTAKQLAPIITGYYLLAKLYCFGEKYQNVRLKNATIDAIIAKSQTKNPKSTRYYPVGPSVDLIYRGTCAGSPARKLMVHIYLASAFLCWQI